VTAAIHAPLATAGASATPGRVSVKCIECAPGGAHSVCTAGPLGANRRSLASGLLTLCACAAAPLLCLSRRAIC
jgi:hypothetical protein